MAWVRVGERVREVLSTPAAHRYELSKSHSLLRFKELSHCGMLSPFTSLKSLPYYKEFPGSHLEQRPATQSGCHGAWTPILLGHPAPSHWGPEQLPCPPAGWTMCPLHPSVTDPHGAQTIISGLWSTHWPPWARQWPCSLHQGLGFKIPRLSSCDFLTQLGSI